LDLLQLKHTTLVLPNFPPLSNMFHLQKFTPSLVANYNTAPKLGLLTSSPDD